MAQNVNIHAKYYQVIYNNVIYLIITKNDTHMRANIVERLNGRVPETLAECRLPVVDSDRPFLSIGAIRFLRQLKCPPRRAAQPTAQLDPNAGKDQPEGQPPGDPFGRDMIPAVSPSSEKATGGRRVAASR